MATRRGGSMRPGPTDGAVGAPGRSAKASRALLLVCVGAILAGRRSAVAQPAADTIRQATAEYAQALADSDPASRAERFRKVRRLFEQVLAERRVANAALYVNLGNAALQGDEVGSAILAYRRALAIDPGHRQGRRNLEQARQLLPDWVPRPQSATVLEAFFWQHTLSRSGRALAAACGFGAAAMLLAVAIRWRRAWAVHAAILPAAMWLALAGTPWWTKWSGSAAAVVVTVPEAVARAADSAGAPARFAQPLPAGTEARVLERRADWVRLELGDGRDAWLRASAVSAVEVD